MRYLTILALALLAACANQPQGTVTTRETRSYEITDVKLTMYSYIWLKDVHTGKQYYRIRTAKICWGLEHYPVGTIVDLPVDVHTHPDGTTSEFIWAKWLCNR